MAQVGGDWYDAIELPGGGIGLVIGDVVGHGVHAATLMGELRAALRAYAVAEPRSPAAVLTSLNALVTSTHRAGLVEAPAERVLLGFREVDPHDVHSLETLEVCVTGVEHQVMRSGGGGDQGICHAGLAPIAAR